MRFALQSLLVGAVLFCAVSASLPTVPTLNLNQYLGHWYQVYSNPLVDTFIEGFDVQCADATYSINPNGTIGVLNRERKGSPTGPVKGVEAWANVPNASLPGQLAVHFPGSPFGAPYWVVQLGPLDANGKYSYSIVTDNFSASLFVLARDPQIFAAKFDVEVLAFLSANGFTSIVNKPLPVPQQGCAPF